MVCDDIFMFLYRPVISKMTQKLVEAGEMLAMGRTADAERIMSSISLSKGVEIMPATFDVLMNHDSPYAQYFAAEVLKKMVIRDWKTLSEEQRNTLIAFPLTCLENRNEVLQANTKQYLRGLYAVTVKLNWQLDHPSLGQLVNTMIEKPLRYCNDVSFRGLGQSIVGTLLSEFGSSDGSYLGIPWKMNELLRESFQQYALPQIISWIWSKLSDLNTNNQFREGYLRLLSEQILSWEYSKRHPEDNDDDQNTDKQVLCLSSNWRQVFLSPHVISSLVCSIQGTGSPSEIHLMQESVVQMCGVTGAIFQGSATEKSNWLGFVLDALLTLMNVAMRDYNEQKGNLLLAACRGICKLSFVHGSNYWYELRDFREKINALSEKTQQLSHELGKRPNDTHIIESVDLLLQVWATNLIDLLDDLYSLTNDVRGSKEQKDILRNACNGIFNSYLSGQMTSPSEEISDEVHEQEYADSSYSLVALVGRQVPDQSLPLLVNLLDGSIQQLRAVISGGPSLPENFNDRLVVLINVGCFLISDSDVSEIPLIPIVLSDYSRHQEEGIPEDINGVMVFTKTILILSEAVLDIQSNHPSVISPLVMRSLLICLSRFVSSYLYPDSANIDVPLVFTAAFQNGEVARERIINIARQTLANFSHEVTVADAAIRILKNISIKCEMQKILSSSQSWAQLASDESSNATGIARLPLSCRRTLMETLCLGSGEKFQFLLPTIESSVKSLVDNPKLLQSDNELVFELQIVLERIRGVCLSSIHASERQSTVYGWVQGIFPLLLQLATTFHSRNDIVITLFDLLDDLVRAQNSFSSPEHMSVLFDCCLSMIRVYGELSQSKPSSIIKNEEIEEDESIGSLLAVIRLLNHIIEWDTLGFAGSKQSGYHAGDMVLIGIHMLLTLLSESFLSHSALVEGFYKLLDGSLALYSGRLLSSSQQLMEKLVYSIHFGLRSPRTDILRMWYEFIYFFIFYDP